MKKFLFSIILCVCFISSAVYAAELPIKSVALAGEEIYVLSENGTLFKVENYDTPNKEQLDTNVKEIVSQRPGHSFDDTLLLGLKNNGELFSYNYYTSWYKLESVNHIETDITKLEQIVFCDTKLENIIYINNSNQLVKRQGDNIEIIASNIKYATTNTGVFGTGYSGSGKYITNDNMLYSFSEEYNDDKTTYNSTFVMSDVKEIKDDIILKINGEVYAQSDEGNNKIFDNVNTLKNNFIKCSPNASLSSKYFAILDTNGNLYTIDDYKKGSSKAKLIATNIKSIFTSQISNYSMGLYAINNNNDLFSCSYDNSYKINIGNNKVSDSINGLSYLKTLDGYLLINKLITTNSDWSVEINDMEKITSIGKIKNAFFTEFGTIYVNDTGDTWSDKELKEFYRIPLSSKSIKLEINNKEIKLENRMQIIDGRTMYPFRECLDIIGASVQWDGEKQIAIGEVPGIKIEFPIGKNDYYINGVKHTMDATTYVDNTIGRTYIPIRYAAERLGYTVDWIEGDFENTISIYK